jgi:DNA primase
VSSDFDACVQRTKETIQLSSIVGERVALRRRGAYFYGCCPFHDDSTPSFWVNDEIGRYGCWGCDAKGDVIEYVMTFEGCSFAEAIERLDGGYVPSRWPRPIASTPLDDGRKRVERARKIWVDSGPIIGTPAEAYLASRALRLENLPDPLNLRFARLSFDGSLDLHPTLVAPIVTIDGQFAGIQRTFLTDDGQKLDQHNSKRSLGALKGNAIHIADELAEYEHVYICEGFEDGLSLSRIHGHPVLVSAGAGMMASLKLPKSCKVVSIACDNDNTGIKAAEHAAAVFGTRGLKVFIERPHWNHKDWNDYLQFWDRRPFPDELPSEFEWVRG